MACDYAEFYLFEYVELLADRLDDFVSIQNTAGHSPLYLYDCRPSNYDNIFGCMSDRDLLRLSVGFFAWSHIVHNVQ